MKNKDTISRQLTVSFSLLLILITCLCVTTYALMMVSVSVSENQFRTGIVAIDLNGGEPVIKEDEYKFEPGMTVEKPFYLQNQSTWAVYYRLFLDNVEGDLADVLEITILDGDRALYEGTANSLTRQNIIAADDILHLGERRDLTIRFHYPEGSGNDTQNRQLIFDLCAEAVQEKNNPDREFD